MTWQYVTRESVKATVKIPDMDDDLDLDSVATTATSVIDSVTGERRFQPYWATRTFDAPPVTDRWRYGPPEWLLLGADLLEVKTLKTDDGTRTFPYTWAAGTYELGPQDAPYKFPPRPYSRIRPITSAPNSHGWPRWVAGGIQIEGKWGVYDCRRPSGATLSDDIDDAVLIIPASPGAVVQVGHTLLVGDEQLYVVEKTSDGLRVEQRGGNGTLPAAHDASTPIQIYIYPVVETAGMRLIERYFRARKDAPLGVIAGADGFMRLAINDPDVAGILAGISKLAGT